MSPLRYMYLDLNSFFASVEQQRAPSLRGCPVAVIPTETEATCAIAASYEAKAYGIKTGTMIYEARRLCPDLICVLGNHEHYRDYHDRIKDEIDRHIPIFRTESIDEFSCQLQGRECTDDGARDLAQRIKRGIANNPDLGEHIRCSIGFSTNRFLAKTATNLHKPDGLEILRHEELVARTRHWTLDKLTGIGRNMHRRLLRAGVGDIDTLYHLPPRRLRHIWGSVEGERFWHKLHGEELPSFETERRTVGHSHVLAPEFRPPDQAWLVAERLTLKAGTRLRRLGYLAGMMHLSIRLEHGPKLSADIKFSAVRDSLMLNRHLSTLWQRLMPRVTPDMRVKKISISLWHLTREDQVQMDMFDRSTAAPVARRREELSTAMDNLNRRFGRDTVVMGYLPSRSHQFSGTKIAFTRIPDKEEFYE